MIVNRIRCDHDAMDNTDDFDVETHVVSVDEFGTLRVYDKTINEYVETYAAGYWLTCSRVDLGDG